MSTLKTKNLQHPDSADALLLNATGGLSVPGSLVSSVTGGGGSISGDRNRVINGSCQIVNVATFVASNNASGYGGPEMFFAENQGAGGQFTQSQSSISFEGLSLSSVRQTVNTANTNIATSNRWSGIQYRFEGYNVFDLRGKPVVASFVLNANFTGVISLALRTATAPIQSYVTTISVVANTPTVIKIPLGVIPSGAVMNSDNAVGLELNIGALNTGTFQTATLNQWQSGNFFAATGATNWGATAGNFIELTRLQLEEGTVATPFVWRSYGQELALTQRYFEVCYAAWRTQGTAGAFEGCTVNYATPKRVIGTRTEVTPRFGNENVAAVAFSDAPSVYGFHLSVQSGGTGPTHYSALVHANARL